MTIQPSFRAFVRVAFGALFLLTIAATGCSPVAGQDTDVGGIRLALALPDSVTISSLDWRVLSATNAVIVQGTIATTDPAVQPSVVTGLPAGVGDVVSMSATTNTGVSCSGTSSPFNVVAGQTVSVPVNIACGASTPSSGLGSAVISGTVVPGDNCPVATAYTLSPAQAPSPSGQITVGVTATDADSGETLTFAWTATAGTFVSSTSASTLYTCSVAGSQTLTVAITDSHQPTACTTRITFPAITCL